MPYCSTTATGKNPFAVQLNNNNNNNNGSNNYYFALHQYNLCTDVGTVS
jgi:hypothetical protein